VRAVGLKELKNRLSEFVRIAAQGERVLVTNRDRVVAELVPPESGRSLEVADAVLADLVRNGILSPPLNRYLPLSDPVPEMPLSTLLDDLTGDREDR
jgi:prevent-host-death family protein